MMSIPKTDKIVAQQFEGILEALGASLLDHRRHVIGDIAYLYVRCDRFRRLLDDLLSKSLAPKPRESIEMNLYHILAEIQNIESTAKDLKVGLDSILEDLPGENDLE